MFASASVADSICEVGGPLGVHVCVCMFVCACSCAVLAVVVAFVCRCTGCRRRLLAGLCCCHVITRMSAFSIVDVIGITSLLVVVVGCCFRCHFHVVSTCVLGMIFSAVSADDWL